jgi:hypothetical protein
MVVDDMAPEEVGELFRAPAHPAFDSREDMEKVVNMGTIEGLQA